MPRQQWAGSADSADSFDAEGCAKLSVLHSPRPLLEERLPTSGASTRRSRSSTARGSSRRRHCSPLQHQQQRSASTCGHPPLQISDQRLTELARGAAATIDWDSLRARSSVWDKRKTVGDFGIYTRRCGRAYHVMASGSVACSVTEMYHVLCTTSSARYSAAMAELHGASFSSGEIVHRVNTRHALDGAPSERRGGGMFDLTVKTATFAKAHVLARDEHWCFLEYFQPQSDKTKFVLTMHSLHPEQVLSPRASASSKQPTNQLQEMAAGYSVVADARRGVVWIAFYAQFVEPTSWSVGTKLGLFKREQASKSTVRSRIMKMAKATCLLPMIVQRRRLGAQVFIDSDAFTPPNTHCICCTAALPLLAKKQRCHLCGYCVCASCSSTQEIERAHTHLASPSRRRSVVRVCLTCTRRVNNANYDNIPGGTLLPVAIACNPPDAPPPSKSLAGLLRASFESSKDDSRKRAIARVASLLLDQNDSDSDAGTASHSQHEATPETNDEDSAAAPRRGARRLSTDSDVIGALDTDLRVPELALDECVLGNAEYRSYPIEYKGEQDDDVPGCPIPPDDELRMSAAREERIVSNLKNAPELEVICSIACKELQCATGLVTLVGRDEVHVLASSNENFRGVVVPREESICSHAVMTDKPLLLPFVDADIRFHRLGAVQQGALNFYCGFPLIAEDDAVVGVVCCLDNEDHTVTQTQYAVMTKLASTASRVMELRAKAEAA